MESNGMIQSFENKSILVTGSTGFLSKLFVEKLLRVQPNVKQLYLLFRPADASSPAQRLHKDVTGKEVFRVLRKKHGFAFDSFISEKVTPVFGDVTLENLGIKDSEVEKKMRKEIDIVANFAATTNFEERYDVALAVNTTGAKHVMEFAKKCEKLEMILHASTASASTGEKPLSQFWTKTSKYVDIIEEEKKLVQRTLDELESKQVSKNQQTAIIKELGLKRAKLYGWLNTYAFTEGMGEITIDHLKGNLPVVIVRPTIVTSTYSEPFPGWTEGFKSLDPMVIILGRGMLPCFLGDNESVFHIIPGDMVVNAIIAAMVNHSNKNIFSGDKDRYIYHISSSTHKEQTSIIKLLSFAYDYFRENPWMDGDISEIIKPVFFPTMTSFREHIHTNFVVPKKEQKVQFATRLAEIYEPYLLFKGTCDGSATDELRIWTKAYYGTCEAELFDFDPKRIDWKDYIKNVHIPGFMKYVVKPHVGGYKSKL